MIYYNMIKYYITKNNRQLSPKPVPERKRNEFVLTERFVIVQFSELVRVTEIWGGGGGGGT